MSEYLQFRAGPYRLLLALEQVVEIGDATQAHASTATGGFRCWRERSLPVLDLPHYLGASRTTVTRSQQVVVGAGDGLHLVDVDRVEGLVELDDARFAQLADLSADLGALVDAVTDDADGCLLRLRQPLAWLATITAAPASTGPETSS